MPLNAVPFSGYITSSLGHGHSASLTAVAVEDVHHAVVSILWHLCGPVPDRTKEPRPPTEPSYHPNLAAKAGYPLILQQLLGPSTSDSDGR